MGFTLTGFGLVERPKGSAPIRSIEVTAQSKHPVSASGKPGRGSRVNFGSTLDDRIRKANHWAPKSNVPKESLGPSATDRLRGKGPGRDVGNGWTVYGPTPEEFNHPQQPVLAVIERVSGDTFALYCSREHARRLGAWVPDPSFITPLPGLHVEV